MNLSCHSLARKALLLLLLLLPLSACSARGPSPSGRLSSKLPDQRDSTRNAPDGPREAPKPSPSFDEVLIPVSPSDPTWGEPDALVTLVQFADFQCPFSARSFPTLDALRKRYGPEELRVVFKNHPLPIHHDVERAHEAAVAVYTIAGSEPFRRYAQLVFSRSTELSPSNLEAWAEEVGVPQNELRRELASGRPALKVAADLKLAAELGVHGTPAFFINGIGLRGAQAEERFTTVIDRELASARALHSSGTERLAVYPLRFRENFRTLGARDAERRSEELTVDPERLRAKIPVLSTDPLRGPPDALVTIVMFSDFQCPFSRRTVATLEQVQRKYEGQVRIVYKDNPLPFHTNAELVAKVARYIHKERGNEAFWLAFDQFFGQQEQLQGERNIENVLSQALTTAGLTLASYQLANAEQLEREISESRKLAQSAKAPGTPYFFINGRRLPGAQPLEKFKTMIETELRIASRIVAEGTSRSTVYEALMATAEPLVPPVVSGNSMP